MLEKSKWVVETRNLTRIYGDGDPIYALDNINLRIAAGELVAVMGPSGSGKSTLLNVIGALDVPTSGQVLINGQDLSELKDKDAFRAKMVGFVFQLHNLLPTLSAQENVEVPMAGYAPAKEKGKRSKELLELVGLGDRMKHLPGQLSGGQRQRVAIARALANSPKLILADEPTGSLDSTSGEELMRLVRDINATQGTTFLVVTHDLAVAKQTDRVIVMQDGRVTREDIIGSPLEEDLKMWRHSGLGKKVISEDVVSLEKIGISQKRMKSLRKFFLEIGEEDKNK